MIIICLLYFSKQSISENCSSESTTELHRTVPLRPSNVTFHPDKITSYSFEVMWDVPDGVTEFDRFSVSIINSEKASKVIGTKNVCIFKIYSS